MKRAKYRKDKYYEINDFANYCGFFHGDTRVNNGYGCNHKDQEEWEWVKISPERRFVSRWKIRAVLARKKYGSYADIMKNKKQAIEYLDKAIFDPEELKKINVRKQGKCYAFSCPLASESKSNRDYVRPHETKFLKK